MQGLQFSRISLQVLHSAENSSRISLFMCNISTLVMPPNQCVPTGTSCCNFTCVRMAHCHTWIFSAFMYLNNRYVLCFTLHTANSHSLFQYFFFGNMKDSFQVSISCLAVCVSLLPNSQQLFISVIHVITRGGHTVLFTPKLSLLCCLGSSPSGLSSALFTTVTWHGACTGGSSSCNSGSLLAPQAGGVLFINLSYFTRLSFLKYFIWSKEITLRL